MLDTGRLSEMLAALEAECNQHHGGREANEVQVKEVDRSDKLETTYCGHGHGTRACSEDDAPGVTTELSQPNEARVEGQRSKEDGDTEEDEESGFYDAASG